ncbi:DoxX family protein [Afipia sp. GAS231]|uniref:DoxX family protein n=1 Tax=Afipia sp. GAS231 TaxID=1882747 RepID=UPI0008796024|nr:DoxX family protein [Afipia sp. GAS231]SDN73342.1 putative oxidoreductase [Afipia sp. GAS231]
MSASTDLRNQDNTTDAGAWVLLFARLSIAPLFLYSGIGKVMAFSATAARLYGGADGFGRFLAAGSIAVELGCATALVLGLFARQAAVILILFTIAATLMFHNFWAAPEAQVVGQTINFLKNLGLIGLLALIAHQGAGNFAVNAALRRA